MFVVFLVISCFKFCAINIFNGRYRIRKYTVFATVTKMTFQYLDEYPSLEELTTYARTARWHELGIQLNWIV